jgi:hypothetical protein
MPGRGRRKTQLLTYEERVALRSVQLEQLDDTAHEHFFAQLCDRYYVVVSAKVFVADSPEGRSYWMHGVWSTWKDYARALETTGLDPEVRWHLVSVWVQQTEAAMRLLRVDRGISRLTKVLWHAG